MDEKWNVTRGFIKMHIIVGSKTKKIYALSVTDEKSDDSPEFERLLPEALHNIEDSSNVKNPKN